MAYLFFGILELAALFLVLLVPPLIPPPVWNNMPLPCAPMLTGAKLHIYVCSLLGRRGVAGHICFGAVLYPITMADFTIADVTDGMLDGIGLGVRPAFLKHSCCLRARGQDM